MPCTYIGEKNKPSKNDYAALLPTLILITCSLYHNILCLTFYFNFHHHNYDDDHNLSYNLMIFEVSGFGGTGGGFLIQLVYGFE